MKREIASLISIARNDGITRPWNRINDRVLPSLRGALATKQPPIIVALLFLAVLLTGCSDGSGATVTSNYVDAEIKVDGYAKEAVWQDAPASVITTEGGTDVTVKSFYNNDTINFLISWPDATKSEISKIWEFDGESWKNGPDQDKLAILWNKSDSVAYFNLKGCAAVCHAENEDKDLWYMATNSRREKTDLWFWLAGISNPLVYVSDRYIDDTYDPTLPKASRKQDKGEVGFLKNGYKTPVELIAPTRPTKKLIKPLTLKGTPYPKDTQMEDITSYKDFKAGDREPFVYFTGPPTESQADIKGVAVWKNGRWSLEMTRALNTGYRDDMPFYPEKGETKAYLFGLMVSDRTEPPPVRHSTSGPVTLEMAPKP